MKITGNKSLKENAIWYAQALGIADIDFHCRVIYGTTEEINGSGEIRLEKGVYVIRISKELDVTEDEGQILAHEMVHLKQYVTGQLVGVKGMDVVIWEGTAYDLIEDPTSWAYWNTPWELEAFGRQQGLDYMRCVAFYT